MVDDSKPGGGPVPEGGRVRGLYREGATGGQKSESVLALPVIGPCPCTCTLPPLWARAQKAV